MPGPEKTKEGKWKTFPQWSDEGHVIFEHIAAFENEILAIQARKEQIVMETDDDVRDKDVPAEKDRIGFTEVNTCFRSRPAL